ncbi:MAG: archaemetzincin [Mariniblastus sp.]
MTNLQSTKFLAATALTLFTMCSITAFAIQQQAGNGRTLSTNAIKKTIKKLKPLHTELGKPKDGEWLATHRESGQTFVQYVRIRPNVLSAARNKLYVQPIGEFSEKQKELIKLSAEYLGLYFNCQVQTLETKSESTIPDSAKRAHPTWGDKQLLTTHILEKVLAPTLPRDAFATIAFTSSDLWPGDGWNFVFGYASFRDRVGVWSLYRNGDPSGGAEKFKTCLRRTIKIATHETGHMFSMQHCTRYECNMQGSNSLPESDAQPLLLCPECHAKVLYATGADPIRRYAKLIEFCKTHGLTDEANGLAEAMEKLQSKKTR